MQRASDVAIHLPGCFNRTVRGSHSLGLHEPTGIGPLGVSSVASGIGLHQVWSVQSSR